MERINLDNNYIFEIINNNEKCREENVVDIDKINARANGLLKIDFEKIEENQYKKILRKLLRHKKNVNTEILSDNKILLGYVQNFNEESSIQREFIKAINAIFYKTRYERYNYIYDEACAYLDHFFYEKNLCDFKNNKCGEKRNTSSVTGCCHHFKVKCLGPLTKLVLCEYLNKENYTCDAKCLGCKLFTCDYLEKKGFKFRIKDILLLDTFFNPVQKYFIKTMVFTPKEKVLKRLVRT